MIKFYIVLSYITAYLKFFGIKCLYKYTTNLLLYIALLNNIEVLLEVIFLYLKSK